MAFTLQDVATIERIVRQQWCSEEESEFEEWMGLDQDQALAMISMIPNRLPCGRVVPYFKFLENRI